MVTFREATRADVPAIVALLSDDEFGAAREGDDLAPYLTAFDAMPAEGTNRVYVGEVQGRIVATYHLALITGLSRRATRRAQVESVRVAAGLRGQGIGTALMADAEARARAAGCRLIQLTSDTGRDRAHAFYSRLGYVPSHVGFKRFL